MPLIKSDSKPAIKRNIEEMEAAGHSHAQSVAAALRTADRYRAKGGRAVTGALTGATGGRSDKLPIKVPDHSHVIPADVVSALGQGNTAHGQAVLTKMFPPRGKSEGGRNTEIMASDGEFVVTPDHVVAAGRGNVDHGHDVLDHFILHVRKQNIEHLKNMPPPAKG